LNGIAATHGDMRLSLSREVGKIAIDAGATAGVAGHTYGLKMTAPNVAGNEAAVESLLMTSEQLYGFGHLYRGDQIHNGTENADGVAGFLETGEGISALKEASKASGCTWQDSHGQAVAAHGGSIDPGLTRFHGKIVHQETRLKVVSTVENQIKVFQQLLYVAGVNISDHPFDGDARIDGLQLALRGNGFGENLAGISLIKENLTLQIRGLDEIAIDDSNTTDASPGEEICGRRTNSAAPEHDGAGREESLLTRQADSSKKDLTRVFFLERIVHG
jgi:hypothetical protein